MKLILALAAVLVLYGQAAAHAPQSHNFKLVAFRRPLPAPEFTLTGPAGAPVRLSDFRGKVLLLNFWATWCPPCVKEMPSMEALYQKFKGRNFVVLAISLDEKGAAAVKPFLRKLKLTFPVALDPDSKVSGIYGARDLPSSFVINGEGQVVAAAKGERDWFSPDAQSYMEELISRHNQIASKK